MALNIVKEVAAMRKMTVNELREKYGEVFGDGTNARNKDWLVKRIAWRMQANEEGGLSERARRRALELANDADLRTTAPKEVQQPSGRGHRRPTSTLRINAHPKVQGRRDRSEGARGRLRMGW